MKISVQNQPFCVTIAPEGWEFLLYFFVSRKVILKCLNLEVTSWKHSFMVFTRNVLEFQKYCAKNGYQYQFPYDFLLWNYLCFHNRVLGGCWKCRTHFSVHAPRNRPFFKRKLRCQWLKTGLRPGLPALCSACGAWIYLFKYPFILALNTFISQIFILNTFFGRPPHSPPPTP